MATPRQHQIASKIQDIKLQNEGLIPSAVAWSFLKGDIGFEVLREEALMELAEEGITVPNGIDKEIIFSSAHIAQLLESAHPFLEEQLFQEIRRTEESEELFDEHIVLSVELTPAHRSSTAVTTDDKKADEAFDELEKELGGVTVELDERAVVKGIIKSALGIILVSDRDFYDPKTRRDELLRPALTAFLSKPLPLFRVADLKDDGNFVEAKIIAPQLAKKIRDHLATSVIASHWEYDEGKFLLDRELREPTLWQYDPSETGIQRHYLHDIWKVYRWAQRDQKLGDLWTERVIGLRAVESFTSGPCPRIHPDVQEQLATRKGIHPVVMKVEAFLRKESRRLSERAKHNNESRPVSLSHYDRKHSEEYREIANIVRRHEAWISRRLASTP